jgi:hypothetical protein
MLVTLCAQHRTNLARTVIPSDCHRDRLNALKVTGDPITFRTAEASHREAVQEKATKFAELVSMALSTWPDDRPWINATDIAAFSTQVTHHACLHVQ